MAAEDRTSGTSRPCPARLDRFDARILEEIQRNARVTAEALAARVGLSAAACQKRLRRLRSEGCVKADIALLDPALTGRITMILQVTLKGETLGELRKFGEDMREAEEVMQCYRVTGDAHFVVIMSVRNMAEYEAFCERCVYGPNSVERLLTSVVKERVKAGFFEPVAAADA